MKFLIRLLNALGIYQQHLGAVEIRFHKDAIYFGEHGTIRVSHVKQGLVETPVRFVFVGLTTPPKMDMSTFIHIWESARAQGYIPHDIVSYGRVNEVINTDQEAEPQVSKARGWEPPVPPIEETIRRAERMAGRTILHVVENEPGEPLAAETVERLADRMLGAGNQDVRHSIRVADPRGHIHRAVEEMEASAKGVHHAG